MDMRQIVTSQILLFSLASTSTTYPHGTMNHMLTPVHWDVDQTTLVSATGFRRSGTLGPGRFDLPVHTVEG